MQRIAQYVLDEDFSAKNVFLCAASSLEELPTAIDPSHAPFILFIALDARSLRDNVIRSVAAKLLSKGMVYVCIWGPDCNRVEDLFDTQIIQRNPNESESDVVITTSHSAKSMNDAVWFFLNCAWPAAAYENTCSDWIGAAIGNPEWEALLRDAVLSRVEE